MNSKINEIRARSTGVAIKCEREGNRDKLSSRLPFKMIVMSMLMVGIVFYSDKGSAAEETVGTPEINPNETTEAEGEHVSEEDFYVKTTPPWIASLAVKVFDEQKQLITEPVYGLEAGWYLEVPTIIEHESPWYDIQDHDALDAQDPQEPVELKWYLLTLKEGMSWPEEKIGDHSTVWQGTLQDTYFSEYFTVTLLESEPSITEGNNSLAVKIPDDLTDYEKHRIGLIVVPTTVPQLPGTGYELHAFDISKVWGQPETLLNQPIDASIDNKSLIIAEHPVIKASKLNPPLTTGDVRVQIFNANGENILTNLKPLKVLSEYSASVEIRQPNGRFRRLTETELQEYPFVWNLYYQKSNEEQCEFIPLTIEQDNDCFVKESFSTQSDPNRVNLYLEDGKLVESKFKTQDINQNAKARLQTIAPNFSEQGYFLTVSFAYQKE
ncbi:hypothetical protein [Thorsellia anophelis]|uniref:Uncharacterized protein n=1 Tax=Thorsellia anophelis DSM 18579 TaxID=1123402 RepID=A0A1I0C920_9GAMM|nr:hypothetical protein [Thorsellia anophelis]SET16061.1 hypothetical protein SAMN02583745_01530 [Thorsellia anophelis DSM 18579]